MHDSCVLIPFVWEIHTNEGGIVHSIHLDFLRQKNRRQKWVISFIFGIAAFDHDLRNTIKSDITKARLPMNSELDE